MLFNRPPTTTMEEDLAFFDLLSEGKSEPGTKVAQVKEPDDKGGDFAGPPGEKDAPYNEKGTTDVNVGDKAAGHRTNVPSRDDVDINNRDSKAEDEEYEDEVVEGKRLPSFLQRQLAAEAEEETQEEQEEIARAQQESFDLAANLVRAYYTEAEDGLDAGGLRTVIEAQSTMIDAYEEALEGANEYIAVLESKLTEGYGKKMSDKDEDPHAAALARKNGNGNGNEDPHAAALARKNGDDDEDDDKAEESSHKKHAKKKAMESVSFFTPGSRRQRNVLAESDDAASLFDDLLRLEQGVVSEDEDGDEISDDQVIEALEQIRDSAGSVCQGICSLIAQDQGVAEDEVTLDPEDERVQIGAHFESIYDDAQGYLDAIAEGETFDLDTVMSDLARMSEDMDKGVEEMKRVA